MVFCFIKIRQLFTDSDKLEYRCRNSWEAKRPVLWDPSAPITLIYFFATQNAYQCTNAQTLASLVLWFPIVFLISLI